MMINTFTGDVYPLKSDHVISDALFIQNGGKPANFYVTLFSNIKILKADQRFHIFIWSHFVSETIDNVYNVYNMYDVWM